MITQSLSQSRLFSARILGGGALATDQEFDVGRFSSLMTLRPLRFYGQEDEDEKSRTI